MSITIPTQGNTQKLEMTHKDQDTEHNQGCIIDFMQKDKPYCGRSLQTELAANNVAASQLSLYPASSTSIDSSGKAEDNGVVDTHTHTACRLYGQQQ